MEAPSRARELPFLGAGTAFLDRHEQIAQPRFTIEMAVESAETVVFGLPMTPTMLPERAP